MLNDYCVTHPPYGGGSSLRSYIIHSSMINVCAAPIDYPTYNIGGAWGHDWTYLHFQWREWKYYSWMIKKELIFASRCKYTVAYTYVHRLFWVIAYLAVTTWATADEFTLFTFIISHDNHCKIQELNVVDMVSTNTCSFHDTLQAGLQALLVAWHTLHVSCCRCRLRHVQFSTGRRGQLSQCLHTSCWSL